MKDDPSLPQMPAGRRATGTILGADEIPAEIRGGVVQDGLRMIVPKRAAKSVAEQLTGQSVKLREQGGWHFIEVFFPTAKMVFKGNEWFTALASLKAWVDAQKAKVTK